LEERQRSPSSRQFDAVAEKLSSPERVIALSDGVFAIVITILVLEVRIPHNLTHDTIGDAFTQLRPTLLAWVVSFVLIGMYWVAHRDIFARVGAVNRDLVWLNLLFLLPTALIPFASSVLGEYPQEAKAHLAYGLVLIAVSFMRLIMYWYVIRHPPLLLEGALDRHSRQGFVLAGLPIAVYLVAMAVSEASATASTLLFLSVPALYFSVVTIARERGGPESEAEDFS
jgi:uncharacterized membrane protein